jgi:hypothetical protein
VTIYETTATVENQGQVRLTGLPFEPGTEVEVTISSKPPSAKSSADEEDLIAARDRMRELFRTVKGFRMTPRIPREEVYERGSLR